MGNQRVRWKEGTLTANRRSQLEALGFGWHTLDSAWENMLAELKHYRDQHGHCNVPKGWRESPQLATWVNTQRTVKRSGRLSSVRKERLDAIGFEWSRKN